MKHDCQGLSEVSPNSAKYLSFIERPNEKSSVMDFVGDTNRLIMSAINQSLIHSLIVAPKKLEFKTCKQSGLNNRAWFISTADLSHRFCLRGYFTLKNHAQGHPNYWLLPVKSRKNFQIFLFKVLEVAATGTNGNHWRMGLCGRLVSKHMNGILEGNTGRSWLGSKQGW